MFTSTPSGKTHRAFQRLATVILTTAWIASCAPAVIQHGHRLSAEDLARIQPGVSSKLDVLNAIGSPSAQATFENDRWYYVTQKTEKSSFYQQELTQQDVITITFATDGTVDNVTTKDLSDAQSVQPDGDKTVTLGNELSLIQQLLGNIGRFNTGDPETP